VGQNDFFNNTGDNYWIMVMNTSMSIMDNIPTIVAVAIAGVAMTGSAMMFTEKLLSDEKLLSTQNELSIELLKVRALQFDKDKLERALKGLNAWCCDTLNKRETLLTETMIRDLRTLQWQANDAVGDGTGESLTTRDLRVLINCEGVEDKWRTKAV